MNCPACGKEIGLNARFCGGCGRSVTQNVAAQILPQGDIGVIPVIAVAHSAGDDPGQVAELQSQLNKLCEQLACLSVSPILLDALSVLATGPHAESHLTLVLGEKSRGKTTLINRLLGLDILPTGAQGIRHGIKVRAGTGWRALSDVPGSSTLVEGLPLRISNESACSVIEGPAAILKHTTVLDTPPINDSDSEFDDVVIKEAVRADLIVVCVSATQLLSESERLTIRHKLLPVSSCEIVLAVTFMDRAESTDDRSELEQRMSRFVERGAKDRLKYVILPPGISPLAPTDILPEIITTSARQNAVRREVGWVRKISNLLKTLEQATEALHEAPPEKMDDSQARLNELLRIVEQENRLALRETEAFVKSNMTSLRITLTDTLTRLTPEALQREGIARLTGEVLRIGKDAGGVYLKSLEEGMASGVPPTIRESVSGISTSASKHMDAHLAVAPADVDLSVERPRDMKVWALTSVGGTLAINGAIILLSAGSALIPLVGGAMAIYGAKKLSQSNASKFAESFRANADATLRPWLAGAESDMLTQLGKASEKVLSALGERLAVLNAPTPKKTAIKPTTKQDVITQLGRCLASCGLIEGAQE